jgi:uncharacterized protein (DUF488 family)
MSSIPIYTIGYGSRTVEEFIAVLQQHEIQFLVDIRSHPYSRFKPEFSREALERRLKECGIRYVFMGDTLGGQPDDSSCYVNGKVDYAKLREKAFFQKGIAQLHTVWKRQLRVALMCSEAKPQECHRSKLVGNTLVEQDIAVAHIDEAGEIKTQDEVNSILMGGQLVLFDEEPIITLNKKTGISRKKHERS